ncbi:MAG: hypothetical protein KDC53_07765 [Saprospiraceae bacterium]|nr:hypothetical protein [Saprospiraceae bacterium]
MKNPLKTILLIIGIGLIGYGIYLIVTPDVQADILGVEITANDNKVSSESILLIALGLLAIAVPRFIK